MNSTTKKKTFYIALISCIFLLFIATFWDLQISETLINYNSWFGTIFQTFGEIPVYFIFVLSGQIAIAYAFRKRNDWLFALPLFIGGFSLSLWQTKAYTNEILSYLLTISSNLEHHKAIGLANSDANVGNPSLLLTIMVWLGIYIVVTILAQTWLSRKDEKSLHHLLYVAVFATLAVWFSLQANLALKDFWGRFRPYELSASHKEFTSWLHPNGINGHKSFPSGHTMAGTLMIVFSWFASSQPIRKKLWIFGVAYGVLLGISRIIIGAHFTSDVVFSFFLTAFIIYIVNELYLVLKDKTRPIADLSNP